MLINLFMPFQCAVMFHDADGLLVNIITLALRRTAGNHIAAEIIPTKDWMLITDFSSPQTLVAVSLWHPGRTRGATSRRSRLASDLD